MERSKKRMKNSKIASTLTRLLYKIMPSKWETPFPPKFMSDAFTFPK